MGPAEGNVKVVISDSRLRELVARELDVRQIARELEETMTVTRDLLLAAGLKAPEPRPEPSTPGTLMLTAKYLREQYEVRRRTIAEIAELTGTSEKSVLRYLRAHGIPRRRTKPRSGLSDADVQQIRARLRALKKPQNEDTVTAIAQDFGRSRQTIYNIRDGKYYKTPRDA